MPTQTQPASHTCTDISFADRASLLGLRQRRYAKFTLPRSGQTVRIRSLSDGEFSDFEDAGFEHDDDTGKLIVNAEQQRNARARLIVSTVCDESGTPVFTPADVDSVMEIDMDDAMALYDAIRDHVGVAGAVARKKARDQLVKN